MILVLDVLMTYVGITHPAASVYGTGRDGLIGLAILARSIVVWIVRQVIQDKRRFVLRVRDLDELIEAERDA